MNDYMTPRATRYLPQVVVATSAVAIVPVALVWWLRGSGVISSAWACVGLALAVSLAGSFVGSAYWKRRRGPMDLMFSELLVWGWLRRVWTERQLASAAQLLGLGPHDEDHASGVTLAADRSEQLLKQLAAALEAQDAYTVGHSRRVARHATLIARRMGLSGEQVRTIRAAAAVHDVGKLRVPRDVLNKPGKLTDGEFELTKRHAAEGAVMVSCLGDAELTAIVRHHHERLDGTGYPDRLAADEIPIGARIVAVADTFDAIISTRPYRPAASHKRAIDVLLEETGAHFDPEVVHAFLSRYAGNRALSLWTALAVLPQTAFARMRARLGVRRPASTSQRVATLAAAAGLILLALAAPVATTGHLRPVRASVASAVSRFAAVKSPAPAAAPAPAAVRVARSSAAHATAPHRSSTCQTYSPQLCSALSESVTASGPATPAAAGSSATLPFTGLDIGLLALAGGLLVGLGVVARRLSRDSGLD